MTNTEAPAAPLPVSDLAEDIAAVTVLTVEEAQAAIDDATVLPDVPAEVVEGMANYHEHCRRLDAERAEFAALFTRPAVHRCVDCRNDIPAESRALARTRGGLCGRCYVLPESIDFPRVLARISRTHSYQRTGRITVVDEHDLREEGAEVGGSGWHWSDGRVVPHHTQWREIEKGERARAADPKGFCVACFCERPTSKHARREELNGKCELCHETGRPAVEVTGGRVGPYCAGYVAPVAPPVPAPVEKAPAPAPILTPKQAQKAANKAKHDKRRAVEAQAAAERAAKQAAEDRADRLAYAMDVANERRQLETAAVVWNAEAERADVTDRRAPRKPGATVTVRVPDDRAKRLRAKARGEKLAKLAKAAAAKPAPTEAPAPTEPPAIHGRRERTPDEARRLADGVEILRKLDGFGHLSEGRARRGLSRILDLWAVSRERAVFQAGKAWFSPTVWGNDEKRAKLTTAIVEALATIAATRRAREEAAQEQQRTPTPVEEVRAAAFAEMVDVADRVLGFGLLRAEIETGVRAAAKAWTLSGFHRSEVGPIAEALFGNYPTKVASVEHARRREVEMMLWALEPIALCAAAEVAAAANGDVFCEPSPELIAEVRDRVNGLTEERARSGLLIALAHWDGDRVSPEAEVHLTRAWFGTHDAKNARRAWQILTEVAG